MENEKAVRESLRDTKSEDIPPEMAKTKEESVEKKTRCLRLQLQKE
jgi:hypothetical protein